MIFCSWNCWSLTSTEYESKRVCYVILTKPSWHCLYGVITPASKKYLVSFRVVSLSPSKISCLFISKTTSFFNLLFSALFILNAMHGFSFPFHTRWIELSFNIFVSNNSSFYSLLSSEIWFRSLWSIILNSNIIEINICFSRRIKQKIQIIAFLIFLMQILLSLDSFFLGLILHS